MTQHLILLLSTYLIAMKRIHMFTKGHVIRINKLLHAIVWMDLTYVMLSKEDMPYFFFQKHAKLINGA